MPGESTERKRYVWNADFGWVCRECSVSVIDKDRHDAFHACFSDAAAWVTGRLETPGVPDDTGERPHE